MKFTILSHASMLVETDGVKLLIDPWLLGSCYWRSWWNYPQASQLAFQTPVTHLYLTHMHWDHFHGPSLRKLNSSATLLLPKAHFGRMRSDAEDCGFPHSVEMPHGRTLHLTSRARLTSYQFGLYLDSILVIDDGEHVLMDMNDCKITGLPLRQIIARHPKVDFIFRSHSSACVYPYCIDAEDDRDLRYRTNEDYLRQFVEATKIVGARYAIPFASNHCFLHKETLQFNQYAVSPDSVDEYFRSHAPAGSECVVMVPGDSWDSQRGFTLQQHDFFSARDKHLAEYARDVKPKLERQYRIEGAARVQFKDFREYFQDLMNSLPRWTRRIFKPVIVFSLSTDRSTFWTLDFDRREVVQENAMPTAWACRILVHPYVLRDCIQKRMFGVFAPSKRLRVELRNGKLRDMLIFFQLLNLHEYGYLTLRKVLSWRFLSVWASRWREILQMGMVGWAVIRDRGRDDLTALVPTVAETSLPAKGKIAA